jgi:hypothetical protein
MGLVIVERSFEHPPSDADLSTLAQRMEAERHVERPAARVLRV